EAGLAKANALGKGLLQTLPTHSLATNEDCTLTALKDLPRAEGLLTQSRINYVGQAVNLYQQGWTYHGSASVVLRFLSMGYLWENVRVRGGAYGAFCSFDRSQGTFRCVSYRDPNVSETLKVYAELADFLQSFSPEQSQLSQAIIGAIGDLDTYQLPSNKAAVAFARLLAHDTDERRQSMREEMFATKASDFNAFGQALASFANGEICVLGGSDVANVAKENDWPLTKVI
ncbi:MAG: peptidase M16, partial [Desulfovibrio sp.]|nr:peptidase M16 [Desulfovibrio sp.]